jgi:hypothetical protein
MRVAPTPLIEQAIAASANALCEILCRSWYFCLLSLRLCYEFREKEREASTWQVPLVALCSSSFIHLPKGRYYSWHRKAY